VAAQDEAGDVLPFDGFERPEHPVRGRSNWLRKDEVARLIETAPDDDLRFILYCGFHAGFRRGEISWARVDWFDLDHNLIHIVNDLESGAFLKDENRVVPLTKPFKDFLLVYLKGRSKNEFVIEPKKQKVYGNTGMTLADRSGCTPKVLAPFTI
jgi:integrase